MKLSELARELRKIFKFKYLTMESPFGNLYFALWARKPYWEGKTGYESWRSERDEDNFIVADFYDFCLEAKLDLSEYVDEAGDIDYSKCIVEVTDGRLQV